MKSQTKTAAFFLIVFCLFPLLSLEHVVADAEQNSEAPELVFEKWFGDNRTFAVSNIVQTADGGYAFLDKGWLHSVTLEPATIYKLNPASDLQWRKSIDYLVGLSVIQTSDFGFEISGYFEYPPARQVPELVLPNGYIGSIVKMDSYGNVEWIENYTSTPPVLTDVFRGIETSDGGQAYVTQTGSIVKTDARNQTQWTKDIALFTPIGSAELTIQSCFR